MNPSSSSPQPLRRTLGSLKKHPSATHKNLFGGSSTSSTRNSIDSPIPHYSPALSPAQLADQSTARRSNSSSQSNPFLSSPSSSHTPPGTWSVSGKLVRKKASGLFREAARSWGRSKSKEVLSFGLGVLIGNQDAQAANSPQPQPQPPPIPPNPCSSLCSASPAPIDHHHPPQHPSTPNRALEGEPTIPSSAGTIVKGPKKRLSFHSSKKVKGKPKEGPKIVKRRSEIGFGDWADTLNTTVDSSSPHSQPDTGNSEILAIPTQTNTPVLSPHPSDPHHLSSHPSAHMAFPYRRRERPGNLTKQLGTFLSSLEVESASPVVNSRVPRSTFPHAHRSPRSPRRFYNTRAAAHRTQSQNLTSQPLLMGDSGTPQFKGANVGLSHYEQPDPLFSSPFKRSISPINQFEDGCDVESPIASKSHGRASIVPSHRLTSVSSARANLFGAMPNKRGSLEPSPRPASLSHPSAPRIASPNQPPSPWLNGPHVHPPLRSSLPRSRQRTVSANLQESSSRLYAKPLTTLTEDCCDFDSETRQFGHSSPLASPSRSPPLECTHSNNRSRCPPTSIQMTGFHQPERMVMPRIEGLDMTPRRLSLDGSLDDSDPDEKGELVLSSQPSSTTSIVSSLTTHELENPGCGVSDCSLKPLSSGLDGFGALPPPESPFPGPHRVKRSEILHGSPSKLKRDVDGELVGSMSQPTLHRHRTSGPVPPTSFPNLRMKHDSFEPVYSPRHSWGRQSNNLSDDDEDDLDPNAHHERDPNNGSHESHERTSNLSVPALTDASSLASSLASSNQSNHPFITRPPVDGPPLISSWGNSPTEAGREAKRRSLPTDVSQTAAHSFSTVPPVPMGLTSTPISAKQSLTHHPSLRPLIPTANSSFQEAECSYRNVKPNASAFLSSRLVHKKTVARDRRENSLSNSSALFKYALSNLHDSNTSIGESSCNVSTEASTALKSMCEALGGPRVIVAAKREDEHQSSLMEQYDQSISMPSGQESSSPNQSSLGIILPRSLCQPSISSLKMPDTPMKKPVVSHKLHSHINKPFIPSGLRKLSTSYSPSIGGSPIDNSPTSRGHQFSVPESPICLVISNGATHGGGSPSRALFDDPDASPSLSLVNTTGQIPSELESYVKQSPMYRRRSSDGVPSNHIGNGHLSKASGSRPSNPFDEPDSPTKAASSWLKRPQFLTSPGNSISSVTSSPSMLHHSHSSVEHLLDSQVTPNRQGGRSYTPFALSPMSGMDLRPGSRSNLAPGPEHSASPPSRRPSFNNRHSSPILDDFHRRTNSILLGQVPPRRSRYDTEFDELETIGKGAFGEVFKVRQNSTGKVFAIKRPKLPANGPKALAQQYEEVAILRRLTQGSTCSPYIIQLYAAWEEDNRWNIQVEFCENGTLEQFLGLIAGFQDRVDEERIWKITSELAQAVAFMHSSGVLHLDIKPANIFITAHGGLKVGDFGLARRWPRVNPSEVRECGMLNGRHKLFQHIPTNPSPQDDSVVPSRFLRYEDVGDDDEKHLMRFKSCGRFVGFQQDSEGDREYLAPEILTGRYGEEADVFSVGLIVFEIATNMMLPDNGDEWMSLRSNDFSRTDLSHLSSELVLLIKRMMDRYPDRRITAADLSRHPVVAKLKTLRDVGLAQEMRGIIGERPVECEETDVLENQADLAGDILMSLGDDSHDLSTEDANPLRPAPPADNIWRAARGAVLPEAEGFLPFILTGQSTPSRLKLSATSCHSQIDKPVPWQANSDRMEIDI